MKIYRIKYMYYSKANYTYQMKFYILYYQSIFLILKSIPISLPKTKLS